MKLKTILVIACLALAAAGCASTSSTTSKAPAPQPQVVTVKPLKPPQAEISARVAHELKELGEKEVVTETKKPAEQPDQPEQVTYDIPIVINSRVEYFIDYFQTRVPKRFKVWLSRSGRYLPMMRAILKEHGLPEDLVYLALIESGFSCQAYSRAHAVGPWQFIRATGRRYGLKINYWVDERRDPVKSTHAAASYLKDLHAEFGSWYLAAAAYNAGENKIRRALKRYKADNFWSISQGRRYYLKRETRQYVPKMIAAAIIAKEPAKYGFTNIVYEAPMAYDVVEVHPGTSLGVAAKLAGINSRQLNYLNPELRRWAVPPTGKEYSLRIPPGRKASFEIAYAKLPVPQRKARIGAITVKVHRGDTLGRIARVHGVSLGDLMAMNPRLNPRRLRIGQKVVVPPKGGRAAYRTASRKSSRSTRRLASSPRGTHKITHRVRRGDTMWHIARAYNLNWRDILRWNGKRSSRLSVGQKLVLYVPSNKAEGKVDTKPARTKIYIVKRGDNLWSIGRRYGVSTRQLKRWNNLRSSAITPGDKLMVKGGGS
ncbi:MAG: LysM peptidoglycan-binding domain-containing protein [Desulfarculaceae bacterium]|nr:LysM peptidoglycan-binding domain-containing protein [Desulfarculaceae bacterium]MCF8072743.1 LysM peptidoglycan-binding domain-containing protein [Desulfarculaceae bacterium]MCF8103023.1 LysM peptidoglycan-binding domain-containing protein [Desulfarculaceae bacterium]MCF8118112.1 LysM peptidoglycan-binding domain-containing protein [Desulfarculaceae bacterium]